NDLRNYNNANLPLDTWYQFRLVELLKSRILESDFRWIPNKSNVWERCDTLSLEVAISNPTRWRQAPPYPSPPSPESKILAENVGRPMPEDDRVLSSLSVKKKPSKKIIAMSKSGVGGAGSGAGSGPTAAAIAAAAQKQKSLLQRVDNDVAQIVDNFSTLLSIARVNDPPVRNSQEAFQMEMRAARMVQASDSLLKLVSELKQTAIFSNFASLNEHVEMRIVEFDQQAEKTNNLLEKIGEQAAASLKELETHYYSSVIRTNETEDDVGR
ncbi:hypothetical protein Taro_045396, partial [Colocasia esculenta]|nr:hypothetical protein [Colocasia esculenta]